MIPPPVGRVAALRPGSNVVGYSRPDGIRLTGQIPISGVVTPTVSCIAVLCPGSNVIRYSRPLMAAT